ncbi:murein biosynthesis integral membrane protein MurJ [Microbacterium sp. SORGH_AS_0888]|uniref:murein biosynthesis integral membrane protein MurJ n=1 Tax=Microbacterium sp. SORGH_AS_0888 TaxID=3041791 RepID=UPI002786042E|nr:murein biosynthesis integral membrane protein MurJ [Microbacterium sp. SORGH_AS_0888]MDQ1130026.1 putative peptidoglycan lipid II flippase [Microbacterium sp. SORGH_AS_0888]
MSGLGRASVVLGAGTLVSRITGLIRSIVLVGVIGSQASRVGDAFMIANQLPNSIYAIISAGVLTAVIVPQIVRESAREDGGRRFLSALFTASTVMLVVVTLIATLCAPLLISVIASSTWTPEQHALATAFAYWCLPQLLFYGLYALLGEALNARRIFGPFTWAPVVNNIVSIVGFVALMVVFGTDLTDVSQWTPEMIALLGGTATAGIALQALVLVLFWRRTGLRIRPDFHWRGLGFRMMARLAGWTALMVIVSEIAGLVQTRLVTEASGTGSSVAVMQNAWLVLMLPYSVIVLSIGTPYFTQLSEHASRGDTAAVRGDILGSIRLMGLFVVAAAVALVVAAVPATRVFVNSTGDAVGAAPVLLAYLVGLVPLGVIFIIQRTFYAYDDTRTPFLFTVLQGALVVGTAWIASATLPPEHLAAGIALGQSLASLTQLVVAALLLHRRIGGIHAAQWLVSLGRYVLAAIPAAIVGWLVYTWSGGDAGWMAAEKINGAAGAAVIGAAVGVVYLGALLALRAPELGPAIAVVRRVLLRR